MRALDPRLVRRTRAARPLLAIDTLLGVTTALAVLAQASVLSLIVAKAFDGAPVRGLGTEFGLLVLAFAVRAACAWGMEVSGRRAAWSVLSELRLALVERRLHGQPMAVDGAEAGELAAVAVDGIGALEGYFARYLPQAVLASVVPLLVVGWVAFVDLQAALVMLLTLPLVPLFMWLIGRYTEERTRERWLALRLLSTHFLDVVCGLPTLRMLNRSRAQVDTIGDVGEQYRRATMGTL